MDDSAAFVVLPCAQPTAFFRGAATTGDGIEVDGYTYLVASFEGAAVADDLTLVLENATTRERFTVDPTSPNAAELVRPACRQ